MTELLKPGEYLDLDTGTRVQRGSPGEHYPENHYYVKTYSPENTERIILEDEEIRQLAELAGYEVTDD